MGRVLGWSCLDDVGAVGGGDPEKWHFVLLWELEALVGDLELGGGGVSETQSVCVRESVSM